MSNIIKNTLNILHIKDKSLGNKFNLSLKLYPEYRNILIDKCLREQIWILDEINLMKGYEVN